MLLKEGVRGESGADLQRSLEGRAIVTGEVGKELVLSVGRVAARRPNLLLDLLLDLLGL